MPVAEVLLDQHVVCGVGNVYRCEVAVGVRDAPVRARSAPSTADRLRAARHDGGPRCCAPTSCADARSGRPHDDHDGTAASAARPRRVRPQRPALPALRRHDRGPPHRRARTTAVLVPGLPARSRTPASSAGARRTRRRRGRRHGADDGSTSCRAEVPRRACPGSGTASPADLRRGSTSVVSAALGGRLGAAQLLALDEAQPAPRRRRSRTPCCPPSRSAAGARASTSSVMSVGTPLVFFGHATHTAPSGSTACGQPRPFGDERRSGRVERRPRRRAAPATTSATRRRPCRRGARRTPAGRDAP